MHDSGSQDHLRDGVSKAGDASCLSEEVAPPDDPRPRCDVLRRYDVLRYVVHSARGWVG